MGVDRSRSTSNRGKERGNEDKVEENIPTMAKNSYTSVTDGGGSSSGIGGIQDEGHQNRGTVNDTAGDMSRQPGTALTGWDNSTRLEWVPIVVSKHVMQQ